MQLAAAEQLFETADGGVSSLLWLDYPGQPVILVLHHTETWRGWPDKWDREKHGEAVACGAERGFGYLLASLAGDGCDVAGMFGQAVRDEQPYRAEVDGLEDDSTSPEVKYNSGWLVTDSYGRRLRLETKPAVHWTVLGFPGDG